MAAELALKDEEWNLCLNSCNLRVLGMEGVFKITQSQVCNFF